jgi:hypothetical protein
VYSHKRTNKLWNIRYLSLLISWPIEEANFGTHGVVQLPWIQIAGRYCLSPTSDNLKEIWILDNATRSFLGITRLVDTELSAAV